MDMSVNLPCMKSPMHALEPQRDTSSKTVMTDQDWIWEPEVREHVLSKIPNWRKKEANFYNPATSCSKHVIMLLSFVKKGQLGKSVHVI